MFIYETTQWMISMKFNEMRKIHTKVINNNARDISKS